MLRPRLPKRLKLQVQAAKKIFGRTVSSEHLRYVATKVGDKWQNAIQRLYPQRGSLGNRLTVYTNGSDAFSAMWKEIQNAKERVWMETFILKPDTVGLRTLDELRKAAERGCKVTLIYDHYGSLLIRNKHIKALKEAGAIVIEFNNIWPSVWSFFQGLRFRDHRKILVVDSEVAFCGGMNLASDYAGVDVGGNGRFRDTHARVEGPAVIHLAQVFENSLKRATTDWQQILLDQKSVMWKNVKRFADGVFMQVLESDVRANKWQIQRAFRITLENAQERCYITTPYFLPPRKLRQAIMRASLRGVDVRILIAGKCDVPIVNIAAKHIYGLFLRKNVKIYEMVDKELHAKSATIDGVHAIVGSFNLDRLSWRHLLEVNLSILDQSTTKQLEEQFVEDLKLSAEVTLVEWEKRGILTKSVHWLAYHLCTLIMR
jgi:cardiolipin synthase